MKNEKGIDSMIQDFCKLCLQILNGRPHKEIKKYNIALMSGYMANYFVSMSHSSNTLVVNFKKVIHKSLQDTNQHIIFNCNHENIWELSFIEDNNSTVQDYSAKEKILQEITLLFTTPHPDKHLDIQYTTQNKNVLKQKQFFTSNKHPIISQILKVTAIFTVFIFIYGIIFLVNLQYSATKTLISHFEERLENFEDHNKANLQDLSRSFNKEKELVNVLVQQLKNKDQTFEVLKRKNFYRVTKLNQ